MEYNFSIQDGAMMFNQRYDWPEMLSGHDAEVVQWRRLIVTKSTAGRAAPFGRDVQKESIELDDTGKVSTPAAGMVFGRHGISSGEVEAPAAG